MNKVKEYMKRKLFYVGLTQEEYRQILPDLQRENRKSLQNFSIVTIIFLLVMFFVSFASADVESNRWVYLGSMLITVIIFAIAKKVRILNPDC